MTLHCANRLGVLSYLYANRGEIVSSLGLSTEDTIAVCDSNYFQGQTLIIPHDEGHSFPPLSIQTQEINLFFIDALRLDNKQTLIPFSLWIDSYRLAPYSSQLPAVFHPPAIA